jgi:hypothetical protein
MADGSAEIETSYLKKSVEKIITPKLPVVQTSHA